MVYEIDFIPNAVARGARASGRCARSGWTWRTASIYPVFNVREGLRQEGPLHLPERRQEPLRGRPQAQRLGRRTGRRAGRDGGPPASRRPATTGPRSCGQARPTAGPRPAVPLTKAQVLRARRRGVVGRRDDGDAAGLAREGEEGRRAHRSTATYDTKAPSWWESMGIMVTYMADGGPGKNPFKTKRRPARAGHPRAPARRTTTTAAGPTRRCPIRARSRTAPTTGLRRHRRASRYQLGDLRLGGSGGNPPVIHAGPVADLRDAGDNAKGIYHSITSCKAPCNRTTGIAYPIADGTCSSSRARSAARCRRATGALQWQTPTNLSPGTYTYFCRIHPFMRGAFRVKQ